MKVVPSARLRSLAKKLLLAAGIILLTLVACELLVSLYYRARSGKSNLQVVAGSPFLFVARPGVSLSEGGIEYPSNNHGMRRETDVPLLPGKERTRVLSYGDSIANGWAVPTGETYAHVLESGLNDTGPRWYEILNMYRGVCPTIASFHVRRDVPRLRPDGVIIEIELLNDVSDEVFVKTAGVDQDGLPLEILTSKYVLSWNGQLLSSLVFSGSFVERTTLWSMASHAVGNVLSRMRRNPLSEPDPDRYYYNMGWDRFLLTDEALERASDRMFDSLAGIHRYLERNDIRFLLLIIPSKYAYGHPRYGEASLRRLRQAEARARERRLPFISLYESIENAGGADVFMDFCHPNGAGNAAIARELRPIIEAW